MLTRFLLSFFPCIRTIWHRNTYFLNFFCCFSSFLEKKVGIFGICWDISEILTDSESAFKSGAFEHLKTIVAWILGTRTLFLLTQFSELQVFDFDLHFLLSTQLYQDSFFVVIIWQLQRIGTYPQLDWYSTSKDRKLISIVCPICTWISQVKSRLLS